MAGFFSFLLGLRAQQPGEYRRLTRIRRRIYTPVARLEAEVVRSAEPIPFGELDRASFAPIRAGAAFGGVLECAWLRLTGEVPADADGAVVLLGIRGEALVYDADGGIVDSVSTVFQQGDLPHAGGRYRPVGDPLAAGTRVELYADVAYNGFILYEVGRGVFHGAQLATRDDTVFGLYYDYLTLVVLAGATEDPALEHGLHSALDAAWRRFRQGMPRGRARSSPNRSLGPQHPTSRSRRWGTATSTWRGCGRCARRGARPPAPTRAPSTRSNAARATSTARANPSSSPG
ncbi:hypothetical protein [Homoserinibacter gongjuensis]|uniref:Alpha-mannosidase Ams1-like N-terminal domain-containing protein n=1 Tax=Homoserinibacter gongjuensis TaxID=1162968 RepID=A0ABQ6JQC6_9MICO|nr:hypothetical protein [Homoserinibacter gongjuensis]GMA90507.1 hypothetical protein GCM10025869_10360 [Homoserinibacter gongjuensis]